MKTKSAQATSGWLTWFYKGYLFSIIAILAVTGSLLLFSALYSNHPFLGWSDPLFGLNNRLLLIAVGIIHIAFCGFLTNMRNLTNQALLLFWLGLNHLLYRAGMIWAMHMAVPFPVSNFLGWQFGINPGIMEVSGKLFIAYLFIGGLVPVAIHLQQRKQSKDEAWLQHWRETREKSSSQKPRDTKNMPTDSNNYIKISCPFCDGHIEFSAGASGRKISCPHCAKTIALPQPV
jgi:ribosomal protein S27E